VYGSRGREPAAYLYADSDVNAGVVLAPAYNRLLCAYSSDGSTQNRKCLPHGMSATCTPGCSRLGWINGQPEWCNRSKLIAALRHEQRWDPKLAARAVEESCAWAPEEVGEMLALQLHLRQADVRKRYNELVLLADTFMSNLPRSIEAIFYVGSGAEHQAEGACHSANPYASSRACEAYARVSHRRTLQHFGLSDASLPLLRLDPLNWSHPFSVAAGPAPPPPPAPLRNDPRSRPQPHAQGVMQGVRHTYS